MKHGMMTRRPELKLLHTATPVSAKSGELVTFSMHVLNVGEQEIRDVELVPRQFSNANLTPLQYLDLPVERDLRLYQLQPGAHVGWTAQYRLTQDDVDAAGLVISSMAATAVAADGTRVRDESDVVLTVECAG